MESSTFVKYPYELAMTEFTAVELKNYFNIFKKIVNAYQQNNAMISWRDLTKITTKLLLVYDLSNKNLTLFVILGTNDT